MSAELLFDIWSEKVDAEPVKLCKVSLPSEEDVSDIAGFAEAREVLRSAIYNAVVGKNEPDELKKAVAEYQQVLQGEGISAGASLGLYLLSGYPVKEAFAALCGVNPVITSDSCLVGIINRD